MTQKINLPCTATQSDIIQQIQKSGKTVGLKFRLSTGKTEQTNSILKLWGKYFCLKKQTFLFS